jgi:hypothetical protein
MGASRRSAFYAPGSNDDGYPEREAELNEPHAQGSRGDDPEAWNSRGIIWTLIYRLFMICKYVYVNPVCAFKY